MALSRQPHGQSIAHPALQIAEHFGGGFVARHALGHADAPRMPAVAFAQPGGFNGRILLLVSL